jgi:copper chaperone CopZ
MKGAPFLFTILAALMAVGISPAADTAKNDYAYAPHTPTLLSHLSGLAGQKDEEAITAAVAKLPNVRKVSVDTAHELARVRFDSHVVSYHQVAQAIVDAGTAVGKQFDPCLKISVPEYARNGNAAKVDGIFAGKRLNQRVRLEPLDKAKGEFLVHFLPLQANPAESGPQGFNGGHLHHPVSDPPPRGLGLELSYEAEDEQAPAEKK